MGRARALALVVLAGTCAVLPGACGGGRAPEKEPTNVVLVTLDTTRADALSPYGNDPVVTPRLSELARESVLYECAHTTVPVTLPAHASMLTGLYPPHHTLRDNGLWALPPAARTLAEVLQARGFQTAAFVAAVVLDPTFGLDQGFDTYVAPEQGRRQGGSRYQERPGNEVVDDALAWLAQRDPGRHFFLWVHLFDAHGPHVAPPGFREGILGRRPYYGEVAFDDAQVGRLLDALRDADLLATTTVMVVGDHGEAFGEKDETSHGAFAYESTLRVPMLLRDPSGLRAGERSRENVSVVDVFPTLAEAAGAPPSAAGDGTSLFRRHVPDDRGVYFETYVGYLSYGWSPLSGWLEGGVKYLHSSEPEVYRLDEDPAESRNVVAEEGERVRAFEREIAAMTARPALPRGDHAGVDGAIVSEIRDLGYAASGGGDEALPDPLAPSDRPSPYSQRESYRLMLQALKLENTGNPKAAEPLFRRVIHEGDGNLFARNVLAVILMQQARPEEAIPFLREALAEGPPRAETLSNLGVCLAQTGKPDAAEEAFRAALALEPDQRDALNGLALVLRRAGRDDEAAAVQARLDALR